MSETRHEGSLLRSVPWGSPTFHVIIATTLIGMTGVSLISPVLPVMQTQFSLTDSQAGLIITMFTLPGIVLAPLLGALADRFNRRAVLVPCLVGFGFAGGAIAFVDSFASLLALRFLQGATSSALIGISVTLIGDLYTGTQRDTLMGVNRSALSIGAMTYPAIGGALATIAWNTPFLLHFLSIPVGLFALYALEAQEIEQEYTGITYLTNAVSELALRETLILFTAVFSSIGLLFGAILTALPLLLSRTFGLSPFEIGLLLAVASAANATVSLQSGRLTSAFSPRPLIVIGFVSYGIALTGIAIAPSPIFVVFAIVFFGIGDGLAMPLLDTELSKLAPTEFRAGVMAVRTSVIRLAQTIGPVAFTGVATITGYEPLLLATGIFTGLLAIALLIQLR